MEDFKLKKVHKRIKDVDISFAEYLFNQATTIRFINVNYSPTLSDFPINKYNFRKLRSAYLNYQSFLWGNHDLTNNSAYKRSVLKYNDMLDFYNKFVK